MEVPKKVTLSAKETVIVARVITPNSSTRTPISADDDIIISARRTTPQHCLVTFSSTTVTVPTTESSPMKSSPEKDAEDIQTSSKPSGRNRRQMKFFGSPIRHAVKETSASTVSPKGDIFGAISVPAEEFSAWSWGRHGDVFRRN